MTPRDEVYKAIDTERKYQDSVWHRKEGEDDPNPLSIGEFILLLNAYSDQARDQWLKEPKPEINALNTIRKIAGIAVNCMEQHGAPQRKL